VHQQRVAPVEIAVCVAACVAACVAVCVAVCVAACVAVCVAVSVATTTCISSALAQVKIHLGWLRLVGSINSQVSFAKEPYKRDNILQKTPIFYRSS